MLNTKVRVFLARAILPHDYIVMKDHSKALENCIDEITLDSKDWHWVEPKTPNKEPYADNYGTTF